MTYIDSEKVYEFAKEQRVKETGGFSKGLNKGLQIMMSAARNRDAIPAADVVAVVRCRECRYAPSGTDDGFGLEWPEDKPYHTNPCPFNIEDGWYSHKPKPDFFCANGKRKDGGQDE